MSNFAQRPAERLPYGVDWSAWLPAGDAIVSTEWIAEDGITVADLGLSDGVHTCLVSGGEPRTTYRVVSRVTTEAGLIAEHPLRIRVSAQED